MAYSIIFYKIKYCILLFHSMQHVFLIEGDATFFTRDSENKNKESADSIGNRHFFIEIIFKISILSLQLAALTQIP